MKNTLAILTLASLLIACNSNSFQTAGGTEVSYLKKGDGQVAADTAVCLFTIQYQTENGSVLLEADPDNPLPIKLDQTSIAQQGELYQVLASLRTGDSVGFEVVAADLFQKTFRAPLPDSIPGDSKIKFMVSFVDQLSESGYYAFAEEQAAKAAEKQLLIDDELINAYMSDNGIDAQRTESGLRYVITEQGTGEMPQAGQTVSVNYAGWILDGPYFDTSVESVAREQGLFDERRTYQPFTFPLGQGRVIKGWDEGIALLNVGSKATLYIPSPLGYGSREAGAVIKANSILVFDVELVGIQ